MRSFNPVFVVALLSALLFVQTAFAQNAIVRGTVTSGGHPSSHATVVLKNTPFSTITDSSGSFQFDKLQAGSYTIVVSLTGHGESTRTIKVNESDTAVLRIALVPSENELDAVVVTGTLKAVRRMESPVPVEVYTPQFFKKNPTPTLFDALQNVNGVRPQLNCNICNTGDIHINGLEGPYTMVLIDGMPIVSSLSTVYGLSGIPNSLVERIEIVKGPASSLYGSEAVGGLINVITKKPGAAPLFTADVFSTTWKELNADLGFKFRIGKKATAFTGDQLF
jgi:outer membrane receptor for ferrienterochelin and colicins